MVASVALGQSGAFKNGGHAAAEQAVTKLEQEWLALQTTHEWAKILHFVAEDFILVEAEGKIRDREAMIKEYKEDSQNTVSVKMVYLAVHAAADNVVLATGQDDITYKDKGGKLAHRFERFTDTWVLREGHWLCVAEQIVVSYP
ncbi:MAG: nuclear transport factor 2 family protein [Acidobacteriia bacterium]|nr:nuclear transport factor 2 family protein [Terriglobia bacterium]